MGALKSVNRWFFHSSEMFIDEFSCICACQKIWSGSIFQINDFNQVPILNVEQIMWPQERAHICSWMHVRVQLHWVDLTRPTIWQLQVEESPESLDFMQYRNVGQEWKLGFAWSGITSRQVGRLILPSRADRWQFLQQWKNYTTRFFDKKTFLPMLVIPLFLFAFYVLYIYINI